MSRTEEEVVHLHALPEAQSSSLQQSLPKLTEQAGIEAGQLELEVVASVVVVVSSRALKLSSQVPPTVLVSTEHSSGKTAKHAPRPSQSLSVPLPHSLPTEQLTFLLPMAKIQYFFTVRQKSRRERVRNIDINWGYRTEEKKTNFSLTFRRTTIFWIYQTLCWTVLSRTAGFSQIS